MAAMVIIMATTTLGIQITGAVGVILTTVMDFTHPIGVLATVGATLTTAMGMVMATAMVTATAITETITTTTTITTMVFHITAEEEIQTTTEHLRKEDRAMLQQEIHTVVLN